jgi:hypothetical protein
LGSLEERRPMKVIEACKRAWRRITFRSNLEKHISEPRDKGTPEKGKNANGQPGKKITFLEMP